MGRMLRIALLVFEALFFNVVIPGHTRGMIELPGSHGCPMCCCDISRSANSNPPPIDGKRAANCAICAFAARVVVPPTVDIAPRPLGLCEVLPPPVPQVFLVRSLPPVYLGRAPPVV